MARMAESTWLSYARGALGHIGKRKAVLVLAKGMLVIPLQLRQLEETIICGKISDYPPICRSNNGKSV
jgi:hypothetical protein